MLSEISVASTALASLCRGRLPKPTASAFGGLLSYLRRVHEEVYLQPGRSLAGYDLSSMDGHPQFQQLMAQRPWAPWAAPSSPLAAPYAPSGLHAWATLRLPGRRDALPTMGRGLEERLMDRFWDRATNTIGDLFVVCAGPFLNVARRVFQFKHPFGPEEKLASSLWHLEHRVLAHADWEKAAYWRSDLEAVRDALGRAEGPLRAQWLVCAAHSMDHVFRKLEFTCGDTPLVSAAVLPYAIAVHIPLLKLLASAAEVDAALRRWREVVRKMRDADFKCHRRQYIVRAEPTSTYLLCGKKKREETAEAKDYFYGEPLQVRASVKVHHVLLDPSCHTSKLDVQLPDGESIFSESRLTDWATNGSLPTASRLLDDYEAHEAAKALDSAHQSLDVAENLCSTLGQQSWWAGEPAAQLAVPGLQ